jgi:hypothetical protein
LRNEYFAFQIGLFAVEKDIENIRIEFSALEGRRGTIPADALTCFNTGGVDPYGKPFSKRVDTGRGKVQPLWFGVDVPQDIKPGIYKGSVKISPENAEEQSVRINLKIERKVMADRGDSEP